MCSLQCSAPWIEEFAESCEHIPEIFSAKKIADSVFSCGLPFVLPSLIKKDLNLKWSFLVSRPLKYFIHFRNLIFLVHFSELWILTTWPQSRIFRFSKMLGNQRRVNHTVLVEEITVRRCCLHWFCCLVLMYRFMFYLIAGRLVTNWVLHPMSMLWFRIAALSLSMQKIYWERKTDQKLP